MTKGKEEELEKGSDRQEVIGRLIRLLNMRLVSIHLLGGCLNIIKLEIGCTLLNSLLVSLLLLTKMKLCRDRNLLMCLLRVLLLNKLKWRVLLVKRETRGRRRFLNSFQIQIWEPYFPALFCNKTLHKCQTTLNIVGPQVILPVLLSNTLSALIKSFSFSVRQCFFNRRLLLSTLN